MTTSAHSAALTLKLGFPKPRQHQPLGGVCPKMFVSIPYSNSEHETCDAANCRSRSGEKLEAREGKEKGQEDRGRPEKERGGKK